MLPQLHRGESEIFLLKRSVFLICLNFHHSRSEPDLLARLYARFLFRICRFREEVIHGGSEALTFISLFGIHSLAISITALCMLLAYMSISSFCYVSQSISEALLRNKL